jgi:hypothetical protein
MDNDEEANKAIEECDNADMDGRTIKCKEATPRKSF